MLSEPRLISLLRIQSRKRTGWSTVRLTCAKVAFGHAGTKNPFGFAVVTSVGSVFVGVVANWGFPFVFPNALNAAAACTAWLEMPVGKQPARVASPSGVGAGPELVNVPCRLTRSWS